LRRRALQAVAAPGWADTNPAQIDQLVRMRESVPTLPEVFRTQYLALVSSDRSESVRRIAKPTLVVHGKLDPLVPVQNGVMLSERIPGAQLRLLEDCGHLPHLERPHELAQAVLDFLKAG
jgi:pimeloyl-ACP methyl ester carboxylesterase